jgi:hypothetical protein
MPTSSLGERKIGPTSLIALWLAIHGGDPAPGEVRADETAVLIAAALDRHLASALGGSIQDDRVAEERLKSIGIERIEHHRDTDPLSHGERALIPEICYKIRLIGPGGNPTGKYITICIPFWDV